MFRVLHQSTQRGNSGVFCFLPELTKGQDVQHPMITAEQLTDAMLDSVSGMKGATPEALEQLRNGLLGILQSAAEQENAHEADE